MDIQQEIQPEDVPDEIFRLSDAYLDAAERLNDQIVRGDWESSTQRGQVILFLAFHAVELSLKGCIKTVQPSEISMHHTLPKLVERLNSLVPGLNYQAPFSYAEPTSQPTAKMRAMMEESDRMAHQRFRYPTNNNGNPWEDVFGFSADLFQNTLKGIRGELRRIRDLVTKYSNSAL